MMLNGKYSKLVVMGLAVAALGGCQSNSAKAPAADTMVVKPVGSKLGGGFTAGMTPEKTCEIFNKYYRTKKGNNTLCKKVGKADFANATIVNYKIDHVEHNEQVINTMVFYFTSQGKLNQVMAVDDPSGKDLEQKYHKDERLDGMRKLQY